MIWARLGWFYGKLKYFNNTSYINIEAEATKMAQSPGYLQRNAADWYIHGLLSDGYTNENQVLGSGSGLGNDVQTFSISLNKGWNKYGIKFQHIAHDPIQIINLFDENGGAYNWDDFTYGISINKKRKNILFNLNIEWVNSKNYLWKNNNKVSNVYVFLNTIYLW